MAFYVSPWATMYKDDDYLISPIEDEIARRSKQLDEGDEEILQLLSSLDNGSADEWEHTDWDAVVKEFLTSYKITRSQWKQVMDRVQKIKRSQPSKKFTCQDLVAIADDVKEKIKKRKEKEEMD